MNNQNINFVYQGHGLPVICIHGIAASLYDWNKLLPELTTHGYRGYALDLPGHGDSPKPEKIENYHVSQIYHTVDSWIRSLNLKQSPFLVGHSLGGYLSLLYALEHLDQIQGLVLIDPFISPTQLRPVLQTARQRPHLAVKALRLAPQWLISAVLLFDPEALSNFLPNERQQIAADYKRASPLIMHTTNTVQDITPRLEKIAVPTLIIWGKNDLTLNTRSFEELARTLPNATIHPISRTGHQPHITKASIVNQLILEFITHTSNQKPQSKLIT